MIISASTGNYFYGVISYVHKLHKKDLPEEQKPKILLENMVFGTPKEQAQLMKNVSMSNARSSRPVLHLSISFHQDEVLTIKKRDEIFQEILHELKAKEDTHQYIIAQHFDSDHEHYHIILNKVGLDRSNINTNYIKNRCQVIADKIEKKLNLRPTLGRTIVHNGDLELGYRYTTSEERSLKKKFLDKVPEIRKAKEYIHNTIEELMNNKEVKDIPTFISLLKDKKINVQAKFDKEKVLIGIAFKYDNLQYKGTQIGIKSKQIQTHFDEKQREILKEKKAVPVEIPWKGELESKISVSKKIILNYENFSKIYEKTFKEITGHIKKGESGLDTLLSIFLNLGFSKVDNNFVYGNFKLKISNQEIWILRYVNEVRLLQEQFEQQMQEYNTLMNKLLHDIPWIGLPSKIKKLKAENEQLIRQKERAEKPEPQLYLMNSSSFTLLKRVRAKIDGEKQILIKLQEELKTKTREENRRILIAESKTKLSADSINLYKGTISKYDKSEDYLHVFLQDYTHNSNFKDLFWLDRKFYSLDSEEDRISFLIDELGLNNEEADLLGSNFFDDDEKVVQMKVGVLNNLPDRLIRAHDEIIKKPRNQKGFNIGR